MPPRKRTDAPTDAPAELPAEAPAGDTVEPVVDTPAPPSEDHEQPAAARKPRKPAAEPPCTTCFPDGWPAEATSAGCSHGSWNRTL